MTEQALRDTMVMLGASLFQRGYALSLIHI